MTARRVVLEDAGSPGRRPMPGQRPGVSPEGRRGPLELFETTADGVMAVDLTGRILLWNRAAEELLGFAAAEVLGKRCYKLIAGRDERGNILCHPHCHVRVMARQGEPVRAYTLRTHRKGGDACWLNVSTILVPRIHHGVVVHLFRDVTPAHPRLAPPDLPQQHGEPTAFPHGRESAPPVSLTRRQQEVLRLLAAGHSTRAIAHHLHLSATTVRNHIQTILGTLGVHSRVAAVGLALRSRLV